MESERKTHASWLIDKLSLQSRHTPKGDVRQHCFEKGKTIVHKGQKIGGVYLVKSGSLRIFTLDLKGNEKPIYSLHGGDMCVFSINCVLRQIAYPAWVTVDSDSAEILSVPTSTFRHLFDTDADVREYVLDTMSQRIFDLMSSVEEVAVYDLGSRINSFLVRSCPEDQNIRISHQDIATSLGTAREVVSRHLKHLENEGHVTLSRMNIHVTSPEALATLPPTEAV